MSTHVHPRTESSVARVALGLAAAAVISIIVNTGVALGTLALNPNGTNIGLNLVAYAPLTVVGVIAGSIGWALVRRRAANARAVLRVLVPVVVVLSFTPDILLAVVGVADVINVVGLLVMHVVVATITVTAVSRVLPLAGYRRTV